MDYSMMLVLDLIVEGEGTRDGLQTRTGYTDRRVRRLINELRKEGYPIVNFGDGRGYFITNDSNEFDSWKRMFLSRAYDEIKTAHIMERNFNND